MSSLASNTEFNVLKWPPTAAPNKLTGPLKVLDHKQALLDCRDSQIQARPKGGSDDRRVEFG